MTIHNEMAGVLANAGLPGLAQEALNLAQRQAAPVAPHFPLVAQPVPQPVQQPAPAATDPARDPLEGTWVTSNGAWHFVKDAGGYRMQEVGLLGVTGNGRATVQDGVVRVQFASSLLGQVTCELVLSGNVLAGSYAVWMLRLPIVLQRR